MLSATLNFIFFNYTTEYAMLYEQVNEKILGYLASKQNVGDVVIVSKSAAFVIDYDDDGTMENKCFLNFDMDKGWSTDEYDSRVTFLDQGTNIAKEIISDNVPYQSFI